MREAVSLVDFNKDTRIGFGRPSIGKEEISEVIDSLRSGWLSSGPKVEKFEHLFRFFSGSRYACALNSCTAALHLSLIVSGIGKGDEVITTPFTFAATANAVVNAGARPVFVDIEKGSMNIDHRLIEGKITGRTRAIIPVHFAGRPCNMAKIMTIARKYKLTVIEDAAHALGAEYRGKKVGALGDLTCFSFYANKNITTGEGGMVTTNNAEWAKKIRALSFNGLDRCAWKRHSRADLRPYRVIFPGYKYSMMDLQAAIGIQQLKKAEHFLRRREKIWKIYDKGFAGLPVSTPSLPEPDTRHARHLYTLLVDINKISRNRFRQALYEKRIDSGIHFIPLHLQPYYRKALGCRYGDFPNSEFISERIVSLPLSSSLTDKEVDSVVSNVRKIFNN
ncbi:MAG: DegT/DnrJ/EryC1/StrS aminotransferase family protein [Candidatus Omnitrophota bacterium]